jgi:4-hydroxy-2-oxoheptanedioate aldolase
MTKNIKERAKKGLVSYGMYINLLDPASIEMAAYAGYDYVRIDCEHMLYDNLTLTNLIRTANLLDIPVQVRVPGLDDVSRLLDFGVSAIVVPHVCSKEVAMKAVNAVKYAPLGRRGMFGNARYLDYGDIKINDHLQKVNDEVSLIVQIEDKGGLENIDEIMSLEGIDMVATGKGDLSQALGFPGQTSHPKVLEAESLVIKKALDYGKAPILLAKTPERVAELKEMGVFCFGICRDTVLLYNSIKGHIVKFK